MGQCVHKRGAGGTLQSWSWPGAMFSSQMSPLGPLFTSIWSRPRQHSTPRFSHLYIGGSTHSDNNGNNVSGIELS